jgi:hypothetical protein
MVLTRESVFAIFKQSLLDNNKPFVILSGIKIYDSKKAIAIIEICQRSEDMGFSSLISSNL